MQCVLDPEILSIAPIPLPYALFPIVIQCLLLDPLSINICLVTIMMQQWFVQWFLSKQKVC